MVAAEGGGHVHWWVFEANNAHAELAKAAGFAPGRHLLQMRRALPLEPDHSALADGLMLVPFAPGGVVDVIARLWAAAIEKPLGPITIENQGAAGGTAGAGAGQFSGAGGPIVMPAGAGMQTVTIVR